MKRTATRRLLAALLTAVLLAGLLPALSLTAGARAPQKVNASSADELKSYLESSADYDITLTGAIDKYIGETEVWCTVRGTKRLDLNGFDVLLHQDGGKIVSYLFRVPADANLTVYDGKNTATTAKIHYHAEILSGNLVGTIAYWRHLFDVYGKLTINNVMCTAGRVATRWNYSKAQNVSVQTYGSAAIVHGGGYLEVNGAYLSGHTYVPKIQETPVVKVENYAQVYFNFGEVHGHGSADCFNVAVAATVQVASGIFDSDYYSKVMWGLESETNKVDFPGRVGLLSKHLAPDAIPDNDDPTAGSRLKVTAPKLPCSIGVYDGSSIEENGVTNLRVPSENPILHSWISEPYFHTAVEDSPQAEHIYRVIWEIYDGLTFVADKVKFDDFDLNLMKDIQGFTPEKGKQYRIRCTIAEHLRQGITGTACWRYASMTSNYYAQIVDDLLAPIIERDLLPSAVFTPGERLQLSIRASGANLRYQWYALDPGRPARPEAISGQTTATLTISNARETLDGAYIYCVVSNAAGSVRTTYCKLAKDQTVVTEIPILNLDQPRHGVPLDTDMDIGVPGVALVSAQWSVINPMLPGLMPMSEAEINNPIAGQLPILSIVVAYDKNVVIDKSTKLTALGLSTTYAEKNGNLFTFNLSGFTVAADGPLEIDLASLSFNNKDLEIGEMAPTLAEKGCGFSDLGLLARTNPDVRYSIQSRKWFVDDVETENPIVEEDHTYTLKVRLQSEPDWVITDDTTILVDGEEVHFTVESVRVGKDIVTCADFGLKYATRAAADDESKVFDLYIDGIQVTSKNRTDVLGNGLFFFDGEKTLVVRGSYTGSTDIITNKGVDGLIIRVEEDSVLSTGKYDQPIALEASAVITGPGKLTLSGGDSGIFVRSKNATLTIRNVNMDVQCRWGIGSTTAANSSKLVIDRANIKVDTDKGAICDFGGGITITNCKILRPEGVGISDDGKSITDAEDAYAKSVEIGAAALLPEVVYTPDSRSVVGGKLTVFIEYMAEASDELMEAYLADEVKYQWYCAGEPIPGATEETLELTGAQKGKSVYVVVSFNGNTIESEYSTVHAPAMPFADVAEGAYYYDAVLWAVNHEPQITNGTDAAHFSPDRTCTRGQVVTFLWRAMGEPEPASTANPFTDVKEGQYFYKAVLWAVEQGVTKGVSPTAFGPDRGCTRGQVVTFLWRAEGQPEPAAADNPFTDVAEGQYYYKAVLWAVEKGITKGTGPDRFSPDATCTRGQIVTFLYRDMG